MPRPYLTATLLLVVLGLAAVARAAEHDLAAARGLLLGGNYAEAAEVYTPMADKGQPAAVLGLARCLAAEGRLDEAVERLAAAADGNAQLNAELARLAFDRGDIQQAQARADEALRLDPHQLLARWIRAELHRTAGRLQQAEDACRWLIEFYNDHDVTDPESLRWIGLGAAHYARWNRLHEQFSFLVNDLYPAALKLDPQYWPACYEAGMLFLEKHNHADATERLQAALAINPNAAEVHVALACLAAGDREIEKAEASIRRALEINPRLLSAWLATADLAWANFDVEESLRLLDQHALPLNPIHEETLGRVAACYLLLDGLPGPGETSRFSRLVEQVTQRNQHAGEFYFALAIQLASRHRHREATTYFRKAVDVMPQLVGPRSELGLLQMQAGQESDAARTLKEASRVDPFNVRVSNTLEVLDVLDSMETLRTDHFAIKYDPDRDALLARYAAEHLETVYPLLCRQFGFEPPESSLIEIFNTTRGATGGHWMGTRLIGLPYIGPVGACTGRMVAITSPYDPQAPRQLNWARVLTHEFVHIITLQQTNFNIPHWYTEGLAVYCEDAPRPEHWNELLARRVTAARLFNLDTINFGFTRPVTGGDCQLAYCQAELYVQYMLSRWGSGRQRRFLAAYTDGLDTRQAIRQAFAVSQDDFEAGYIEYLKQVVASMSSLEYPSGADFTELLSAHRENPDDARTAAELAYAYLLRRADDEALSLAEAALRAQPKEQLAAYVLARLWLKAERTDEATGLLERCLDRESPQPAALNLLAVLKLNARLYDEAAGLYSLGERLDSINLDWTRALARVYLISDDQPKLAEVLARLAEADPNDLTSRKKLAQMALDRADYAAAARWAEQAIQIDVMDPDLHHLSADALLACGDCQAAVREFEALVELQPTQLDNRLLLAHACIRAQQPDKARGVLEILLDLDPDHVGASALMQDLQQSDQP